MKKKNEPAIWPPWGLSIVSRVSKIEEMKKVMSPFLVIAILLFSPYKPRLDFRGNIPKQSATQ